jgi:hypothetical protein
MGIAMQQVSPELRKSERIATAHNGQPIWLTVCEELIAGRWEGFITIEKRPDEETDLRFSNRRSRSIGE